MQHDIMKNLHQQIMLSQHQKDVLIGLLLGDASISINKNGNAYISFEQGIKNREYLYSLYQLFKPFAQNEPKEYKRLDKRNSKESYSLYFRTQSLPLFYEFANIFLKMDENSKVTKIVPLDISHLLTPVGLAYWICDDGQEVKTRGISQGLTLCTDNFIKTEVLMLKTCLEEKFGFKCSIHNKNIQKGYYRIYISKLSMPLLQSLVSEYMHPSMLYKIGL